MRCSSAVFWVCTSGQMMTRLVFHAGLSWARKPRSLLGCLDHGLNYDFILFCAATGLPFGPVHTNAPCLPRDRRDGQPSGIADGDAPG